MSATQLNNREILDKLRAMSKDGIYVEVWKACNLTHDNKIEAKYSLFTFEHGLNKAEDTESRRGSSGNRRRDRNSRVGIHTFLHELHAITWHIYGSSHIVVRCTARLSDYIAGGINDQVMPVAVFSQLWMHLDEALASVNNG